MSMAAVLRRKFSDAAEFSTASSLRAASSSAPRSGFGSPHRAASAASMPCFTAGDSVRRATVASLSVSMGTSSRDTRRTDVAVCSADSITPAAVATCAAGGPDRMKSARRGRQDWDTRSSRWAGRRASMASVFTTPARTSALGDLSSALTIPASPALLMAAAAPSSCASSRTSSTACSCSCCDAPMSRPDAAVARPPAPSTAARPSAPPSRATLAMMWSESACAASFATDAMTAATPVSPRARSSALTPLTDDVSRHSTRAQTLASTGARWELATSRRDMDVTPSLSMISSRYPASSTCSAGGASAALGIADASDLTAPRTTRYMGDCGGLGPRSAARSMVSVSKPPAAWNACTLLGESSSSACAAATMATWVSVSWYVIASVMAGNSACACT